MEFLSTGFRVYKDNASTISYVNPQFLNDVNLDSRQMYFVQQVVKYIIKNGMMKDLSVLQESPFTDRGSIVELFDDRLFRDLRRVIEQINNNAVAA